MGVLFLRHFGCRCIRFGFECWKFYEGTDPEPELFHNHFLTWDMMAVSFKTGISLGSVPASRKVRHLFPEQVRFQNMDRLEVCVGTGIRCLISSWAEKASRSKIKDQYRLALSTSNGNDSVLVSDPDSFLVSIIKIDDDR